MTTSKVFSKHHNHRTHFFETIIFDGFEEHEPLDFYFASKNKEQTS